MEPKLFEKSALKSNRGFFNNLYILLKILVNRGPYYNNN